MKPTPWLQALNSIHLDSFRPMQLEVLESLDQGNNILGVFPTGFGKSLIYQLWSYTHSSSLTLVVSPLISLMQDQKKEAKKILGEDFSVEALHSNLTKEQRRKIIEKLKNQKLSLLLVSPERFLKPEFQEALKNNEIDLFVVDEAHCLSQWGHDFRPDYTRLNDHLKNFNIKRVLALTATATYKVRDEIKRQLNHLGELTVFSSSSRRDELEFEVVDCIDFEDRFETLMNLLKKAEGPTIIYFSLIQTLRQVSERIGFDHVTYHGQLPQNIRKRNQKDFINDKVRLCLATPAFGLGVNKSNIKHIIHFQLPNSIESYYQEIGRASRNQETSQNYLLYDPSDLQVQMDFISWQNPDEEFIKAVFYKIESYPGVIKESELDVIKEKLLFYNRRDFRLETAINLLKRYEILDIDNKGNIQLKGERPNWEIYPNFQKDILANRKKNQQKKLYDLIQWCKLEGDEQRDKLFKYFDEAKDIF